jgi:hypothetical protein
MKTGNIVDNRVGLAPNPEEKPKVVKKTLAKKASATPKKPSPNKPVPPENASKKAKPTAKVVVKKKITAKANVNANKNASLKTKINKNAPKYRFNSPSNQELSANNFEEIYKLEGHGLSRSEFKRQMK